MNLLSFAGFAASGARSPFGVAYVLGGKFNDEKTPWGGIGNIFLLTADLTGAACLVLTVAGVALSALATLGLSLLYLAAYLPIGLNAVFVLADEVSPKTEKRQALLDLANAVFQVALIILIVAAAPLPALIVIGGVAVVFGSLSFLHRMFCTNQ